MKRVLIVMAALALALLLCAGALAQGGTRRYCQTVYIYQQPGTGFRPPSGPIAGIPVRISVYYGTTGCGGSGQLICRSDWRRTNANGRVRVCCEGPDIGSLPLPSAICVESNGECRSPWWQSGPGGVCHIAPELLPYAGNVHFGVGGSGGGAPTPTPTATPQPTPTEGPPPKETPEPEPTPIRVPPTPAPYNPPPAQPVVIHFGVEVDKPVVIEQDPDRRGRDAFLELRVPAVVYDYEVEYAPGMWAPQRQVKTDYAVLLPGRYRFTASLTSESRAWIQGELAARYPNARIVRPNWDLARTEHFQITDNYVDAWGRHTVRMQAVEVPFVDPGVYQVAGRFVTTGTRFTPPAGKKVRNVRANGVPGTSTRPRNFTGSRNLHVWMLDSFLIE